MCLCVLLCILFLGMCSWCFVFVDGGVCEFVCVCMCACVFDDPSRYEIKFMTISVLKVTKAYASGIFIFHNRLLQ